MIPANTERNAPCPCGSGKKFKKCCLQSHTPHMDELKRKRWANIRSNLIKKILTHVNKVYGPEAIYLAYEEFHLFELEEDDGFDPDSPEMPLFMPWFFFDWSPDPVDLDEGLLEGAPDIPPALSLVQSGRGLTPEEKEYILACCQKAFSFYEIVEVVPNQSLKIKDIMTGETYDTLEKKGSQNVQPGDVFFGKAISIDGHDVLEAVAPIIIPPIEKLEILDLKKDLQKLNPVIDHFVLKEFGLEILESYWHIFNQLTNPTEPILTNTDGNLILPHKLIFAIEDAEKTFEALSGLCVGVSKRDLLADESTTHSEDGRLKSIHFPWLKKGNKQNKTWDNTVLGHLSIDGQKMTVEVNSKERAKKFEAVLKKRMPKGWKLISTLVEPAEPTRGLRPGESARPMKPLEPIENSEMDHHIQKMLAAHWDDWIYQPLPALEGLSPMDATQTETGREAVLALLNQFERNSLMHPMPGQSVETFQGLRRRLGLSVSSGSNSD